MIKHKFVELSNDDGLTSDSSWTIKVKKVVGNLGISKGYIVCASGVEEYEPEWLYDLLWYHNNSDARLQSVPLVMESEWSKRYGYIRYDFEKLLISNAPMKIIKLP